MLKTLTAAALGLLMSTTAFAERLTDQPLVDSGWLQSKLGNESLVVVDIRAPAKDAAGKDVDAYAEGHIAGAVNAPYGVFGWRAKVGDVVGQLPPVDDISAKIGSLGIDNSKHVVIVPFGQSSTDFGAATRVYWTFKVLGHDAVSILDGGAAAWAKSGNAVSSEQPVITAATFTPHFRAELLASAADVAAAPGNGIALVDARPEAQFKGLEKSGVVRVAGTIPGAINIPQSSFYDDKASHYASPARVGELVKAAGLSEEQGEIAFCNTGHWASVAWFGLSEVRGKKNVKLYDGSMTEWASDPSRPVVK
jgi:thiosulfate/3-mercaptopyruvate sulfurtransferase